MSMKRVCSSFSIKPQWFGAGLQECIAAVPLRHLTVQGWRRTELQEGVGFRSRMGISMLPLCPWRSMVWRTLLICCLDILSQDNMLSGPLSGFFLFTKSWDYMLTMVFPWLVGKISKWLFGRSIVPTQNEYVLFCCGETALYLDFRICQGFLIKC